MTVGDGLRSGLSTGRADSSSPVVPAQAGTHGMAAWNGGRRMLASARRMWLPLRLTPAARNGTGAGRKSLPLVRQTVRGHTVLILSRPLLPPMMLFVHPTCLRVSLRTGRTAR